MVILMVMENLMVMGLAHICLQSRRLAVVNTSLMHSLGRDHLDHQGQKSDSRSHAEKHRIPYHL